MSHQLCPHPLPKSALPSAAQIKILKSLLILIFPENSRDGPKAGREHPNIAFLCLVLTLNYLDHLSLILAAIASSSTSLPLLFFLLFSSYFSPSSFYFFLLLLLFLPFLLFPSSPSPFLGMFHSDYLSSKHRIDKNLPDLECSSDFFPPQNSGAWVPHRIQDRYISQSGPLWLRGGEGRVSILCLDFDPQVLMP